MGKRVLNLLEAGNLRRRQVVVKRITVIEFGVNDGCGNGVSKLWRNQGKDGYNEAV